MHRLFFVLSHQDSNLGKQNQNLMCYHYTMGQKRVQKYYYFSTRPNLFFSRLTTSVITDMIAPTN